MDQVFDPSVNVFEEIDEQAQASQAGGTTYFVVSWLLGNRGYVCTLTVECQSGCRRR